MGRWIPGGAALFASVLLCAAQSAGIRDAATALQRGDAATAEQKLRAETAAHPDDAWALSLLGYTLDSEKKYKEAEEFHSRAMALSPGSAEILNNYGTHLWALGQYGKAETVLSDALAAAPGYFNVLYNLGMMATYTGHYERAREVLEIALHQQPRNVDVLYRLASVDELSKHWEAAVARLAQAARLDPKRADVQKLLALTTTELGALDDAAAAWDRYLALAPNDEAARRERGYTAVKMGKLEQGIADIEWFLAHHPEDAVGHYELGQAERSLDVTGAMLQFDKALAIDPKYAAALAARGSLSYQSGKPESAVKDLEMAAALEPGNAATLDRLGQTYQALDRAADSVRVLRRAAELAPGDSKALLHLGRALADAGQTEESKQVMDRFRQLGPEKNQSVPEGLVSYLSLTPDARRKDYRARVEKVIHEHPSDSAAQLAYLKLLLEDRDANQLAAAAKRIAELKPAASVLADAGHALLEGSCAALASDLLQQAIAAGEVGPGVQLDMALATFQASGAAAGAKAGLDRMNLIPESERRGDYYLARAQMLDASPRPQEAAAALGQAVRASPDHPDVYVRAAAFLVSKGRAPEALRMIGDGARALPDNREILLMQATTLEFTRQTDDAATLLKQLQRRWPEWPAVWTAHGIILAAHQHYAEAQQVLEAAVALGSRSPETYFFLAKTYDVLGRKAEAQTAREKASPNLSEAAWLIRVYQGSLLHTQSANPVF